MDKLITLRWNLPLITLKMLLPAVKMRFWQNGGQTNNFQKGHRVDKLITLRHIFFLRVRNWTLFSSPEESSIEPYLFGASKMCCLCVRIDCAQCRSRMEWTSSTNVCKITPGGASTAVFLLHSCPWSLEPYRAVVNIHMLSIHRSRLQAASLDTPPSRACGVSIHIEKSKLGIPNSHFPTQLNSARFWHRDITT